jgi:adenylate kinase
MNLVLLGPPGAGKGTFANLIKEKFGLCHISTGDMLREEMKSGSDLGKDVKRYVESGALVPDGVIIKIIENKLADKAAVSKGYLLDGFPRTTQQAQTLDEILANICQPIDYVLNMETELDVIIQRLNGRRICKDCGAIYHIVNMPSRKENVCDRCTGALYQRADDNEATIRTRMEVYIKSTKPIIEYYERQQKLYTFNANRPTADLLKQLIDLLHESEAQH